MAAKWKRNEYILEVFLGRLEAKPLYFGSVEAI
jgi:hypothetical protein